jgi:hypothetical protein
VKLTKDQKKEKFGAIAKAGVRRLEWQYHDADDTNWEASSQVNDNGNRFKWRIDVTEIGRFSIANSDGELIDATKYQQGFTSLQAAQNVCQSLEDGLVVALTKQ